MKTNLYVQFAGQEVLLTDLVEQAKSEWRAGGKKLKDIDTLDLYVKPEERRAYYAVNGEQTGEIGF